MVQRHIQPNMSLWSFKSTTLDCQTWWSLKDYYIPYPPHMLTWHPMPKWFHIKRNAIWQTWRSNSHINCLCFPNVMELVSDLCPWESEKRRRFFKKFNGRKIILFFTITLIHFILRVTFEFEYCYTIIFYL